MSTRVLLGMVILLAAAELHAQGPGQRPRVDGALSVMSFNLWHGGEAGGQPLEQTQAVIEAAQADIVGLQETAGHEQAGQRPDRAQTLAQLLKWHYVDQGDQTGVLSRYPIVAVTPQKTGVRIQLPTGESVWVFNVHLAHAPYQPYQLLKIPYADAPFIDGPDQAVAAAVSSRGTQINQLLAEIRTAVGPDQRCFVTGDFNEPSHLDWTAPVVAAGRCPCVVAWPNTAAVIAAGFQDAFRQQHPDPLAKPGYTWTSITREDDPADHHDRIDFVFLHIVLDPCW